MILFPVFLFSVFVVPPVSKTRRTGEEKSWKKAPQARKEKEEMRQGHSLGRIRCGWKAVCVQIQLLSETQLIFGNHP